MYKRQAIAIITEWDEFKDYDWQEIYNQSVKPANLFDGRNLLDKQRLEDIGFDVYSIGR